MKASDIPAKFPIPFANSASGTYKRAIPVASQIGITPGAASLTDGFVPLNFTPRGAGGIPPFGVDFNGLLNQSTAWSRWQNAGGVVPYDATFQTAIGGYPNGAIVASATTAGLMWRSTADDNVTNPDTGGAGWVIFTSVTSFGSSGYVKFPSGLILQWATFSITPALTTNAPSGSLWGTATVTWPLTFPTGCFYACATPVNTNNGQYTFGVVNQFGSTSTVVTVNTWNTATLPIGGAVIAFGN